MSGMNRYAEANGEYLIQFEDGLDQYGELYKIPTALFAENRQRLVDALKAAGHSKGVVVLKGGEDSPIPGHSSDNDMAFRQESFFMWAFGVQEAGFFGAVDVASGKSILFIPKLPEEYVKWYGEIYPPAYFAKKYAVSETHFVDDIVAVLKALDAPVLVNKGVNTDSDRTTNFADFEGINTFTQDDTTLHPIITELRAIKTQKEQELLKWINWVSSKSHVDVMQSVKPKMGEHQAESLYKHFMFSKGGCRHCQYQQICATGVDNAVLHYPSNNKVMKDGTLALFDMGCEYSCYGSDITVTFPVNGKFTDEQKIIYNAVYAASMAVMEAMGPGVNWVDMHVLANRVTLEHLKEAGLVRGDIEKMMEVHLCAAFQPHGLGHLLGLDVHDVGGYPKGGPERPTAPGLRSLRTARDLLPGMFITVEPGCYFNTICLDKAFENPDWKPFLNEELIREKYWGIGGVRIEENVMVTDTGCELYTIVPRTVDEVEKVLSGGEWNATERGTTKFSMTRKYK